MTHLPTGLKMPPFSPRAQFSPQGLSLTMGPSTLAQRTETVPPPSFPFCAKGPVPTTGGIQHAAVGICPREAHAARLACFPQFSWPRRQEGSGPLDGGEVTHSVHASLRVSPCRWRLASMTGGARPDDKRDANTPLLDAYLARQVPSVCGPLRHEGSASCGSGGPDDRRGRSC